MALLSATIFVNGQQAQQDQNPVEQEQKPKPRIDWGYSDQNNDEVKTPDKPEDDLSDLLTQVEEDVKQIVETHGSVKEAVKKMHKEHVRICPTCGGIASQCPADKDRLSRGNIMKCACKVCKGTCYF